MRRIVAVALALLLLLVVDTVGATLVQSPSIAIAQSAGGATTFPTQTPVPVAAGRLQPFAYGVASGDTTADSAIFVDSYARCSGRLRGDLIDLNPAITRQHRAALVAAEATARWEARTGDAAQSTSNHGRHRPTRRVSCLGRSAGHYWRYRERLERKCDRLSCELQPTGWP